MFDCTVVLKSVKQKSRTAQKRKGIKKALPQKKSEALAIKFEVM